MQIATLPGHLTALFFTSSELSEDQIDLKLLLYYRIENMPFIKKAMSFKNAHQKVKNYVSH